MLPVKHELPADLNPGLLHLFILGPGLGESIVLRSPSGKWFVIDSYFNQKSGILPEIILKKYDVAELEALVLTHPDEDHYKGLVELTELYPVRKVACTGTLLDGDVVPGDFDRSWLPDDTQLAKARKGGAVTYVRFSSLARDGKSQCLALKAGSVLHQEDPEFRIVCHSPDETTFKSIVSADVKANQVSAVLEVVWGKQRWILGADLPKSEWERLSPELATHLKIKVPHHGSSGSISTVWTSKTNGDPRDWLVTPFNRGSNRPPQPEALAELLAIEQWVHLTSVPTRYGHCVPGDATLAELKPPVPGAAGLPPGDSDPAEHCVIHVCYNRDGKRVDGRRLPGTLAVTS